MSENEKYIVVKVDNVMFSDDNDTGVFGVDDVLSDAVVIRPQDIFAGSGLSAYANAVQTFLEAIDWHETVIDPNGITVDIGPLEDIRDFFFEQANIARMHPHKKVPDA